MRRTFIAFAASIATIGGAAGAADPLPVVTLAVDTAQPDAVFRPLDAMGSTVDKEPLGSIPRLYSQRNVHAMLGAGLGWLSYRLFSELSTQDWHWNPRGTFSNGNRGYWTSSSTPTSARIDDSYQYALPHRGATTDQGNNASYSRIDDGDPSTYWKSNPYLTQPYTHEPDSAHPQWIVVDLGRAQRFNTVRIAWGSPYATRYALATWTGDDPLNDPGHGIWRTFANGRAQRARFVRVSMTQSSNTCDTHGSADRRNCVGYAVREISIGTTNGARFDDLVRHVPGPKQTPIMVSSVDPWHTSADRVNDQEQPGLDLIASDGITRAMPGTYPVPMLYSTPENAVAEIRYLEGRRYPIRMIELGEEPDGQFVTPEDDAELYIQWARAIHAADPSLRLGGPVFSGTNDDVQAWPDASGDVSWLHRFLRYLRAHGALGQLAFMSFEHYPFDGCEHGTKLMNDLLQEPSLPPHMVSIWRRDGVPASVPIYVTEANFSAVNFTQTPMLVEGALWLADYFGSSLTAGVSGVVYYQYEPVPISRNGQCPADYGNLTMFVAHEDAVIRAYGAQYYGAQMLTRYWVLPGNAPHTLFRTASSNRYLSAYTVHRPDGAWSMLIVNKDARAHSARPAIGGKTFRGTVDVTTFGPGQYVWRSRGRDSLPDPDRGPETHRVSAAASYVVPGRSLTVLRGTLQP